METNKETEAKMEEKTEIKAEKIEQIKEEIKPEELSKKEEANKEIKKEEKAEVRKEKKKEEKKEIKKDKAILNATDLHVSTKESVDICNFIRKKKVEQASYELGEIAAMKRALPMKGELPHRHGMERGRYPKNACNIFINLLKTLMANSIVNGLENPYIAVATANLASRPYKRFGSARFKRTNIYLEAREGQIKEERKREIKENKKTKEKKKNG